MQVVYLIQEPKPMAPFIQELCVQGPTTSMGQYNYDPSSVYEGCCFFCKKISNNEFNLLIQAFLQNETEATFHCFVSDESEATRSYKIINNNAQLCDLLNQRSRRLHGKEVMVNIVQIGKKFIGKEPLAPFIQQLANSCTNGLHLPGLTPDQVEKITVLCQEGKLFYDSSKNSFSLWIEKAHPIKSTVFSGRFYAVADFFAQLWKAIQVGFDTLWSNLKGYAFGKKISVQ